MRIDFTLQVDIAALLCANGALCKRSSTQTQIDSLLCVAQSHRLPGLVCLTNTLQFYLCIQTILGILAKQACNDDNGQSLIRTKDSLQGMLGMQVDLNCSLGF